MFDRHAGFRASLIPAGGGLLYVAGGEHDDCQFLGIDWALAESLAYRQAGYDIVHMTSMPEAKLAREAEITYAVVVAKAKYEKSEITYTISFDSDMKLAGLFLK